MPAFVTALCLMVLSACGKSEATQPGSGSSDTSDHAEEEIRDEGNASLDDPVNTKTTAVSSINVTN